MYLNEILKYFLCVSFNIFIKLKKIFSVFHTQWYLKAQTKHFVGFCVDAAACVSHQCIQIDRCRWLRFQTMWCVCMCVTDTSKHKNTRIFAIVPVVWTTHFMIFGTHSRNISFFFFAFSFFSFRIFLNYAVNTIHCS